MGTERIYIELSKAKSDSYYVKLAYEDVLLIPVLIDILNDKNSLNVSRAIRLIEKISIEYPRLVYPYFHYIAKLFEKKGCLNIWSVWRIISNILKYDIDNLWESVRGKYYNSLNSQYLAEFSIACDCAKNIADAKPEESEKILVILNSVEERSFLISGEHSTQCDMVAIEKAKEVLLQFNSNDI